MQESSHTKLPARVDAKRLSQAIDAADFIVNHHHEDGSYSVDKSWGPEGEIYRAICVWILLDIYTLTGHKNYLKTAQIILQRFKNNQRKNGGWPICLGQNGLRFKVTDSERQDSNNQEDPVIAGAMIKAIADYSLITESNEFKVMGEKAYQYIVNLWDDKTGSINENQDRELATLRSNPDAYHFLLLQGISAWAEIGSNDAKQKFPQILAFVRKTFEKFNNETMPLMMGYHVAILSKHYPSSYRERVIKPRLEEYLQSGLFASNTISGGYGHHDGLRGIVTDELHMRSAIGLVYAMKAYDYAAEAGLFTLMNEYKSLTNWIDSMKSDEGGFYEFQDEQDGVRYGKGSPGQYLPALWILGSTLK